MEPELLNSNTAKGEESKKRRLELNCNEMNTSPRKKRKCNTAPPDTTNLDSHIIKAHEYGNMLLVKTGISGMEPIKPLIRLTQSASPRHEPINSHPTVTILSSYDCSNNSVSAPPPPIPANDKHHSNVAISRNTLNTKNININTFQMENESLTHSQSQIPPQQKKPVFSMTIQKKTKNATVSLFNYNNHSNDAPQSEQTQTETAPDANPEAEAEAKPEAEPELEGQTQNHNQTEKVAIIKKESSSNTTNSTISDATDFKLIKNEESEHNLKNAQFRSRDYKTHIAAQRNGHNPRLMRLLLDAKRVGGLIGKGGCTITKIRQNCDAKILIAKPIQHSLFRICSIEGECEPIICGIHLITDVMAQEQRQSAHSEAAPHPHPQQQYPYQVTMLVEEKNIGCLIGKKGNAITQIRNHTNANIYISSHLLRDSSEKTVDIYGERGSVHSAITMIVKKICLNAAYVHTQMLYDPSIDIQQTHMHSHTHSRLHSPVKYQNNTGIKAHALPYNNPYYATLNQTYSAYPYAMNHSHRLLNYAYVQPQIISTTAMGTPSLLTPLLSTTPSPSSHNNFPHSTSSNPNSHVSYSMNNHNNTNNSNNNNNRNKSHNNRNYVHSVSIHNNHNNTNNNNSNNSTYSQRLSYYNARAMSQQQQKQQVQQQQQQQPQRYTSVVLPVASHLIGGVIGRGGRNIQEIRRQTNAEIKIDNERQNKTKQRYITINGSAQQIRTAVYMIQNSMATHTPQ